MTTSLVNDEQNTTHDNDSLVQWSFNNTLSTKYLGRESSIYLYKILSLPIVGMFIFLSFTSLLVIQALCIFMVLDWITHTISTVLFICLNCTIFFTQVDVQIARRILLTFTPVVNLALIVVGLINFALTMNHFDYRGQFGIPSFLGTLFVVLLDSYPPNARATFTIPSLILIVSVNGINVIILALRRYPLYLDYTYDFGDINGLSVAPITYNARELASSTIFANFILCIRMLLLSVWHRNSNILTLLNTPVRGMATEEDDIIFQEIIHQQQKIVVNDCFKRIKNGGDGDGGSNSDGVMVHSAGELTSGMIVKVDKEEI
jgi:hypothetical protein